MLLIVSPGDERDGNAKTGLLMAVPARESFSDLNSQLFFGKEVKDNLFCQSFGV